MASQRRPHLEIRYDAGTIVVRERHGVDEDWAQLLPERFVYDSRVDAFRGPAITYRELMLRIVRDEVLKVEYTDYARKYEKMKMAHKRRFPPHDYQSEALAAWKKNGFLGTVILPTGAGKSYLAELALAMVKRPTLIVTPTLDLVSQWHGGLESAFQRPIGLLGGGHHIVEEITVTTYHSAHIHAERYGDRFGLIVYDEVHHLPGESYALSAESCLAPFRLGMTATPERPDLGHERLPGLCGDIIYEKGIKDLAGIYLSKYRTVPVEVELSEEERERYQACRDIYRGFRDTCGVRMNSRNSWQEFLKVASRSREGRAAMQAYREQKRIAMSCRGKLDFLDTLLQRHSHDRVIVFTNDNSTAYEISRLFLLPVITHHTHIKERKEILERFNDGTYPAVVTSRVLNEGVNVPSANIAVVMSGTSSVREHVQRLGRVIRKGKKDKQAILYELVAANTNERYTSERRRDHDAYQ